VNLSDPIISRFDILCVVKDEIDEQEDEKLSKFILNNLLSKTEEQNFDQNTISVELLKKFVMYAKENFNPIVSEIDSKKISQLYVDLRRESIHSGVPITVRHVESIVRISEAFAKLRLSNTVLREDIERAIQVSLGSFMSAQKYSISK